MLFHACCIKFNYRTTYIPKLKGPVTGERNPPPLKSFFNVKSVE